MAHRVLIAPVMKFGRMSGSLKLGTAALAALLVSYACSSDETGDAGSASTASGVTCIDGLTAITLDPADKTFTLDGKNSPPVTFTANGTFADGSTAALDPNRLAWTVSRADDTDPGVIAAGVLTPYPYAGGIVTVTATDTCVSGATTATFILDVTIGQPNDPADWTTEPVVGEPSATIVYPSDETRFPRNLYRQLFQWYTNGFLEFRLVYEGPFSKVTVYTDGVHATCATATPAAGCWQADETPWLYIAGSNAGATATWVVDSLDESTMPPTIRRTPPIDIGFSKEDVKGAIFYWSTTSAGVRRGKLSSPDPEDYIVGKPIGTTYPDGDVVQCVACHTVSRDGKYLVAPVKSADTDSLWITEVTNAAPPNPLVKDVPETGGHGFATISPDNAHVVVSFKQDHMWMIDRATGAHIVDLPTQAFGGGTHPDWSPDNTQLVFASNTGDAPGDSSLVVIPWTGSDWGQPTELLPPLNAQSNLFPMFDHAGQWIAFANGNGGHGDTTAQLWILPGAGGTPIELALANQVTNNVVTDGQYQNSQPTWAPPGDLDWIAFNSKRPYGVVLAEGTQQIWVAAVDLDKAASGEDPSYPAFRVPFQGLEENNHRAYWTVDIFEGTGGGGQGGSGAGGSPCQSIVQEGDPCSPIEDCCEPGTLCDTLDNGENYICIAPIVN